MSGALNKVQLIGNLGADPEIRRTQDGRPIVNFNLATSESWRDKISGERKERTEWHRVVVFSEGLAKVAEQYLRKGMKIYVEGKLQTRKWQDQQGIDRYTTEVVLNGFDASIIMLDGSSNGRPPPPSDPDDYGRTGGNAGARSSAGGGRAGSAPRQGSGPATNPDLDDEIPF